MSLPAQGLQLTSLSKGQHSLQMTLRKACSDTKMFPLTIWNNSNNNSLDILELLLNTSKQNSFHELSKNKRETNPHFTSITATACCNCKLLNFSHEGTTNYWRDFSFLSFPLPNEKWILSEFNEIWKFREYTYTHYNIVNHHDIVILCIRHNMNMYTCSV